MMGGGPVDLPSCRSWTWVHHLTIWGSIVMWYVFMAIYAFIFALSPSMYKMFYTLVCRCDAPVRPLGLCVRGVVMACLIPPCLLSAES